MLSVLGRGSILCDGLTRRELMRVGSLSLFGGLTLPHLLRAAEPETARRPARAKSVILFNLLGGPSHMDMFDLKPQAPAEVRGEFKPIATSLTGLQICEHLPSTAKLMHKACLIRTISHTYNSHDPLAIMTGFTGGNPQLQAQPTDPPDIGAICQYLGVGPKELPGAVCLPCYPGWGENGYRRGGPYGGFLGAGYDPVWAEFLGDAPKTDPYRGITLQGRFQFGLPGAVVDLDQLNRRRSLLKQLEDQRPALDAAQRGYDRHQSQVFRLLASPRFRRALDLSVEPVALRERYGLTLFGQGVLAARRLIEHGVQLVTVIWDEYKEANSAWDTHTRQHTRLKDELLPGFDRAYSALLTDLHDRGLLDDTLVLCMSEHGRTPKLNTEPGGGRDHWSQAYCGLFAGGGIRKGAVLGASDRIAAFPKEHPVSPKDVLCTIYHLLGVDPHHTHLHDREGRPVPLVPEGEVLRGLIA